MTRYRDFWLFVLLAVVWGTAFTVIKAGLAYLPPVLFAAIRYDLAGVIMLAYAATVTDRWRPRTAADWVTVAVGATLLIAAYNAFLFTGQRGVTSAVAAVLIGMNPLLATGFSRGLLPTERLAPAGVVGLLLGFVGVGVIARPDPSNLLAGDAVATGFVLAAATSVALGSVLVQRVDAGIATEGMVAWSTALGAILLHLVSLALPGQAFAQAEWTPVAVASIAYLAVFASALGYFIYFDLLGRLGAVEINLVSYATPVFAAAAGWLALDETLDAWVFLGFSLIFAGFALLKREALREEVPKLRRWLDRERGG